MPRPMCEAGAPNASCWWLQGSFHRSSDSTLPPATHLCLSSSLLTCTIQPIDLVDCSLEALCTCRKQTNTFTLLRSPPTIKSAPACRLPVAATTCPEHPASPHTDMLLVSLSHTLSPARNHHLLATRLSRRPVFFALDGLSQPDIFAQNF